MSNTNKSNKIENIEKLSQLDFGGVLKDVHSFPGHYLRVKDSLTIVKQHYDYLTATYDTNGQPNQVKYYVGLTQHESKINILEDINSSLNNKYFFIFEGRSDRKFHVWYNVNGAGVDPLPSNSTGIEITINANDLSVIVTYATELVLNSNTFKQYFSAKRAGSTLYITAVKSGLTSNSVDINTGFSIVNTPGSSELVQVVDIFYNGSNPIFEGQELKNYYYNIFKGSFEKNQAATTNAIWNSITTTFPSTTSELYTYKLDTTVVQTILVHYENSTKKVIINVEKTRF